MDEQKQEQQSPPGCLLPKQGNACQRARFAPLHCKYCGWNEAETARRAALPIEDDEDGLGRKHVGITRETD